MFVYNVSIKLSKSIVQDWLIWMQKEHMQEVLATNMFERAKLFQLVEPAEEEEAVTYVVQYFTMDKRKYEHYLEEYAPILRDKGFAKFGNQFIAFRSLLEEVNAVECL